MTTRLRRWTCLAGLLCAAGAALALAPAPASEVAPAPDARPELSQALPQARLVGTSRLTVWGFQIYDARLWAPASFAAGRYATSPMALELSYLRNFKALDIAERSLKEMRRSQPISNAQAALWKADMLRVPPDVEKGERILGVHRPGRGATFWVNGKASGEIRDAEFARLFFGIWLSPNTSEPQMRAALLAGAGE
ncbi:MAG: chalcone isomerase family protein [Polaromonas sp.]